MKNGKSFGHEADSSLMAGGELHMPNLKQVSDLHIYETDPPNEEHIDGLLAGRPLVREPFAEQVSKSLHVVTLNKIIESKRSAHGVGFGSLKFIGETALGGKEGGAGSVAVALKPFNDPETAMQEMYGYVALKALGVETFDPIGVFPAAHGEHYIMISEKRNDLLSLDRDKWIPGGYVVDEETAATAKRNAVIVGDIADMLGYIHVNGVYHPDGQIKNWARTPEGEIGVIDTENLRKEDIGHSDSVSLAWNDIEKLTKSLILLSSDEELENDDATVDKIYGVGMFAGLPTAQARKQIESLIIQPYLESLGL
ncbi:hypothetical protein BH23PAT2_BH23PAT2_04340 [soil metagenome]